MVPNQHRAGEVVEATRIGLAPVALPVRLGVVAAVAHHGVAATSGPAHTLRFVFPRQPPVWIRRSRSARWPHAAASERGGGTRRSHGCTGRASRRCGCSHEPRYPQHPRACDSGAYPTPRVSTAERIGSKRRSKLPSLKGAMGLAKVHSCWRFKLGVDYRQRVDVAVGGWPAGGSSRHSSREYGRGG